MQNLICPFSVRWGGRSQERPPMSRCMSSWKVLDLRQSSRVIRQGSLFASPRFAVKNIILFRSCAGKEGAPHARKFHMESPA